MHKRAGLAAFDKDVTDARFRSLGQDLIREGYEELSTQFETFQQALAAFSQSHAAEIRADPRFRREFADLCAAIGIDPLLSSTAAATAAAAAGGASASARRGGRHRAKALTEALGIADIYNELAVQVVEQCRRTRATDGGIVAVADLTDKLNARRARFGGASVSAEDVERAVDRLAVLQSGFECITVGSRTMVRSVPRELDGDEATVLEAASVMGYVSRSMLCLNLGWDRGRAQQVLDDMVGAGLVWIDAQGGEVEYWTPSQLATA